MTSWWQLFCGISLGNWASLGVGWGWGAARSRAEKVGKLLKLELALEGGCEVGHSVVLDSLWPMTRIKLITLNMLTLGLKALHW